VSDKIREERLRRAAKRQGLALVKSRSRHPDVLVYGTYGLVDPQRNAWVASSGGDGYGLDLDEIEQFLTGD
jgi:hypothetical protein